MGCVDPRSCIKTHLLCFDDLLQCIMPNDNSPFLMNLADSRFLLCCYKWIAVPDHFLSPSLIHFFGTPLASKASVTTFT